MTLLLACLAVVLITGNAILVLSIIRVKSRQEKTQWQLDLLKRSLAQLGIDVEPSCEHCRTKFQPHGSCHLHPLGCKFLSGDWGVPHPDCKLPHPY